MAKWACRQHNATGIHPKSGQDMRWCAAGKGRSGQLKDNYVEEIRRARNVVVAHVVDGDRSTVTGSFKTRARDPVPAIAFGCFSRIKNAKPN